MIMTVTITIKMMTMTVTIMMMTMTITIMMMTMTTTMIKLRLAEGDKINHAERIRKKHRLRRICTFRFRGW
jgi:hypothetical protein